ncbi:MAG: hypothetical protein WDO70_00005, partial [Alphaproteobacteria bacterium]
MRNLFLLSALLAFMAVPAFAEDFKPDDYVALDLNAEAWVTTTTARVTVNVDAAVASNAAGTMRADMLKAVSDVAKAEWRLTNFSRGEDQTGLERWNASFESRLPENQLSGLHDAAKKASKAGMQLTVAEIAFDPTLAEVEAVKAKLRADLYKQAGDQLAALNAAFPNRQYRAGAIDFTGGMMPMMGRPPMPMMMKTMAGSTEGFAPASDQSMERGQKLTQHARVTFSALPPAPAK